MPGQQNWGVSGLRSDYGIPLPQGTPVQAPVSGIVLPQHLGGDYYSAYGQQSFGGEVDIASNVPAYGGLVNVGVIHLDSASVKPGDVVQQGQIIGTSGGQTSGGNWPSNPLYSSGPHIGIQVHSLKAWDDLKDPGILVGALQQNQPGISTIPDTQMFTGNGFGALGATIFTLAGSGDCSTADKLACGRGDTAACARCAAADAGASTAGNCAPWDIGCILKQLGGPAKDIGLRIAKFTAGMLLIGIALFVTFLPEIGAAYVTGKGFPEAAGPVQDVLRRRRGRGGTVGALIRFRGAVKGEKTLGNAFRSGEASGLEQSRQRAAYFGSLSGTGSNQRFPQAYASGQVPKKVGLSGRRVVGQPRPGFQQPAGISVPRRRRGASKKPVTQPTPAAAPVTPVTPATVPTPVPQTPAAPPLTTQPTMQRAPKGSTLTPLSQFPAPPVGRMVPSVVNPGGNPSPPQRAPSTGPSLTRGIPRNIPVPQGTTPGSRTRRQRLAQTPVTPPAAPTTPLKENYTMDEILAEVPETPESKQKRARMQQRVADTFGKPFTRTDLESPTSPTGQRPQSGRRKPLDMVTRMRDISAWLNRPASEKNKPFPGEESS